MRTEKLYHHCFLADDLQEGDLVPVGGGVIGSEEMPYKVKLDFEDIYPQFARIADKYIETFEGKEWQDWLKQTAPDYDPKLLALLQSFTVGFNEKLKLQANKEYERSAIYRETPDNVVNLSEIFNRNHAMCVEIALLAKKFLDEHGIKSKLFSGEAIFGRTEEIEFASPHTFLLIEHDGKELFFDPANPSILSDGRPVFAALKPCCSIAEKMDALKSDTLMIETSNIITGNTRYYGTNDLQNILERQVVRAPQRKDGNPWITATNTKDERWIDR